MCPKLITLKYPEDNISGKSVDTAYIELIFKDAPKVSASNVKKRRTMMLEALLNVLFQFYKNNAPKPHIEIDFQRLLTSGELNFSFENCQLNLMENTNIDEASTNAIEERIYSISSESFLARLKCCDIYRGQISHVERVHGREAKFDTLKLPLPQILLLRLESCLNIKGICDILILISIL